MRGSSSPGRVAPAGASLLAALAITALVVLGAGQAHAEPNPGISPGRIAVDDPVRQGDELRLPSLTVFNRGDEAGEFIVDTGSFAGQAELVPDASWFRFEPDRFEIEASGAMLVSVRMNVPRDAVPGDYRILLTASVEPDSLASGGATISVAVAVNLTFTVENRDFHFYDPVTDFFRDRAPFSYIGVGLLLALLAAYLIRRRLRFRISFGVERRE